MVRQVDGTGFAFIPRSLVAQPAAFGLVPDLLVPAASETMRSDRYRAAMLQHLMCFEARSAVRRIYGTSPALHVKGSTEHGLGEDRVRRVFRGATMAQFTDFAFWTDAFPSVGVVVSEYVASWSASDPEPELASDSEPAVKESAPGARAFKVGERVSQSEIEARRAGSPLKQRRRTPQNPFG